MASGWRVELALNPLQKVMVRLEKTDPYHVPGLFLPFAGFFHFDFGDTLALGIDGSGYETGLGLRGLAGQLVGHG